MDSKKFGILFGGITLLILLVFVNMTFYHVSLKKFDDKISDRFNEYEESLSPIDELLQQQEAANNLEEELPQVSEPIVEKPDPIDYFEMGDVHVPDDLIPEGFELTGASRHPLKQNIIYFSVLDSDEGVTDYYAYDYSADQKFAVFVLSSDEVSDLESKMKAITTYGSVSGVYIDEDSEIYLIIDTQATEINSQECKSLTLEDSKNFVKVNVEDFHIIKDYQLPNWVIRQSELKAQECESV